MFLAFFQGENFSEGGRQVCDQHVMFFFFFFHILDSVGSYVT
jgi:hypothetical protein